MQMQMQMQPAAPANWDGTSPWAGASWQAAQASIAAGPHQAQAAPGHAEANAAAAGPHQGPAAPADAVNGHDGATSGVGWQVAAAPTVHDLLVYIERLETRLRTLERLFAERQWQ